MSLSRVVSGIGRLLVGAGVLVLLFVGYQLWGTGLHEARAQDQLERDFHELVSSTTTTAPDAAATPTTAPTELPSDGEATNASSGPAHPIDPGDVLARIEIPRIGVDKLVVQGVSTGDLRKGPGHYPTTVLPGHIGNAAIAGHRTTYGAPFADIDKLAPGDDIIVSTVEGRFTYRVTAAPNDATSGHFIVKPSDVWVLDNSSDARLTLTACHPKYSAKQRIIVVATLVDQPVSAARSGATGTATGTGANGAGGATAPASTPASKPAASVGDHLGGDGNARLPMILWGLAFLALLGVVWQVGLRWKRWPSYALGALPLALVLFIWFEQIDRWMPAR